MESGDKESLSRLFQTSIKESEKIPHAAAVTQLQHGAVFILKFFPQHFFWRLDFQSDGMLGELGKCPDFLV